MIPQIGQTRDIDRLCKQTLKIVAQVELLIFFNFLAPFQQQSLATNVKYQEVFCKLFLNKKKEIAKISLVREWSENKLKTFESKTDFSQS